MKLLKRLLVDLWGRRNDDFNWRKSQCPVDLATVQNVCLLHLNEKLGDAVIDSLLVSALQRARPEVEVFVGTTTGFEGYWRAHPHVRDVALFPPSKGRSALGRVLLARRAARPWRGRFDVVVSFESFAQPDHFALLRSLAPKVLVGFHKNRFRLFDYSLDEGRHGVEVRHVSSKIVSIMRVLGTETDLADLRSHVPFGPADERAAGAILDHLPRSGRRMLLHVHGSNRARVLSPAAAAESLAAIRRAGHEGPVWVGVPTGGEATYEAALRADGQVAVISPTGGFGSLFALVAAMDLVVAIDTSVGHVAAALGKPQVVLFPGEANVPTVWRPLNARSVVLVAPDGEGVDAIAAAEIEAAIRTLLAWTQPTAR